MNLGRVLKNFNYYAMALLRIQNAKVDAANNSFDVLKYEYLKRLVLGQIDWHDLGTLSRKSELELVRQISIDLDHLLQIKERLIQHVFAVFVRTNKPQTRLYFDLLNRGQVPLSQLAEHSKDISILRSKLVVGNAGDDVRAIPLTDIPYSGIHRFLRLIHTFEYLQKALRPGLFKKSLISILRGEANALQKGNYGKYMKLYGQEKAYCYGVFHAIRSDLEEDLQIAHSVKDPYIATALRLVTTQHIYLLHNLICVFCFCASLGEQLNFDVQISKLNNNMHRSTAISGIEAEPAPDGTPITDREKRILSEISSTILSNPGAYFIPSKNPAFKFSGNVLSFDSVYMDRFFHRDTRVRTDGKVYASFIEAPNSKKVVLYFPFRSTEPGHFHNFARKLKERGISSLIMMLPGHDLRKNDSIDGQDPIFRLAYTAQLNR